MEKLTRILAIVDRIGDGVIVLDKAVALARRFGARVEVMLNHPDTAFALAKLCNMRAYGEVTLSSVHGGGEPLHQWIQRRVAATHPDLVIKAPTGTHPLQRWTLGENDWQLANDCPAPLLLVRQKPWTDPVRFAVAVDVADENSADLTRNLLHTAGFLALGCHGNLDVLYSEREREDDALRMERAVRLAQVVREFHVGCERIQVHTGEPADTLPPLAASRQYDVLVLGARSRKPAFSSMFGSLTSRMVEATDGDVVLVKAGRDASSAALRHLSEREQRFHEPQELV